ncbi:MAG: YggS family pyridoxal phosphate-dependent enzyme [Solirubrobacteraceae bacterium]
MALSVEAVRRRLADVRAAAGPRVRVLAAIKYLPLEDLPALATAGVALVGENRAQELAAKHAAHGELFAEWHFIGALQSRKVRQIAPLVSMIHSVASDSALRELERHGRPELEVLIEVNVAGEPGKAGIAPEQLGWYIDRCPVPVVGLMTMPPQTADAERSRRWFAALAELARAHDLRELSMGTSQDWPIAVEEGATIIRLGSALYE